MSTTERHNLAVSKALLDEDLEGMKSQSSSYPQCLYTSEFQLCLYVLILGKGIHLGEEKEKLDTLLPGIPGLCLGQNQR